MLNSEWVGSCRLLPRTVLGFSQAENCFVKLFKKLLAADSVSVTVVLFVLSTRSFRKRTRLKPAVIIREHTYT